MGVRTEARTGNSYNSYLVASRAHFKEVRKKWYPNGIKVVPPDLVINNDVFSHWFMGDGTVGIYNGNSRIHICSEGFDIESLNVLKRALLRFGIKANITTDKDLRILITSQNLGIIMMCFPDWESPVRFYQYKIDRLKEIWGRK